MFESHSELPRTLVESLYSPPWRLVFSAALYSGKLCSVRFVEPSLGSGVQLGAFLSLHPARSWN